MLTICVFGVIKLVLAAVVTDLSLRCHRVVDEAA
jgi:hypothetical protein